MHPVRSNPAISALVLAVMASLTFAPAAPATDNSLVVNRLIVVSAAGTDVENGQALRNTLSGITDAAEGKRYTLRLEPGTYDVGDTTLAMKSFVDLEGSGEETTLITGNPVTAGVLFGKVHSEVRHVTIEHRGGVDVAATVINAESARFSNVTIRASGATTTVLGIFNNSGSNPVLTDVLIEADCTTCEAAYGMANLTAAPLIDNVRIRVHGGTDTFGIDNGSNDTTDPFSPLVIRNVDIELTSQSNAYGLSFSSVTDPPAQVLNSRVWLKGPGSTGYGVYANLSDVLIANSFFDVAFFSDPILPPTRPATPAGSSYHGIHNVGSSGDFEVRVDNSQIHATDKVVENDDAYTTRVGGSLLSGGDITDFEPGTVICAGVWDEDTVFYPSHCPGQTPPMGPDQGGG